MALVPLGNYVFFLAQLQTFGYVAVYFAVLYWRYRSVITLPCHLMLVTDRLSNSSMDHQSGQEL